MLHPLLLLINLLKLVNLDAISFLSLSIAKLELLVSIVLAWSSTVMMMNVIKIGHQTTVKEREREREFQFCLFIQLVYYLHCWMPDVCNVSTSQLAWMPKSVTIILASRDLRDLFEIKQLCYHQQHNNSIKFDILINLLTWASTRFIEFDIPT